MSVDENLDVPRPDARGALTAPDDPAGNGRVGGAATALLLAAVEVEDVAARAVVTLAEQAHLEMTSGTLNHK